MVFYVVLFSLAVYTGQTDRQTGMTRNAAC